MSTLDRRATFDIVRRVLSADCACEEECFSREGVSFFLADERAGRRRFPSRLGKASLSIVTMGQGVVVTCSPDRLDWARENLGGLGRDALFGAPILARLQELVGRNDQVVYGPNLLHVCSPDTLRPVASPNDIEFCVVEREAVPELYKYPGFRNALNDHVHPDRPDVLAVTASRDEGVVGIAGVSADSDDLWQVGVDVMAGYRGMGIGQALVSMVTEEVCSRGKVPYYATVASNLASRNVANRVGFVPCWIEVYCVDKSRLGVSSLISTIEDCGQPFHASAPPEKAG